MAEIVTVTLKTAKSSSNVGQSSFYFVIRFLSVFADVQGVASVTSISSLGHPSKIDYNCETSSYWCDDERYSQANERQYLDKALPVQRASAEVCLEELHFTRLRLTFDLSFHCYILLGWWHASCDRRCRDHLDKSLDSADQLTRHNLAQLVVCPPASTQVERTIPVPEPAQKPWWRQHGFSSCRYRSEKSTVESNRDAFSPFWSFQQTPPIP